MLPSACRSIARSQVRNLGQRPATVKQHVEIRLKGAPRRPIAGDVAGPVPLCDNLAVEVVTSDRCGGSPVSELKGYHAHVYYNAETKPIAARLRETLAGKFAVEPRDLSDEPRGPHPISPFAVVFRTGEFQNIAPWLMLNREGLDVLVHPLTESSYDDHSKNAMWLGTPVPMRLDVLRPTYRAEQFPKGASQAA
jgi:aromatic ring-cleaving dioxygenase